MNGEEGLEIASQYIVSQAKLIGIKPASGTSFYILIITRRGMLLKRLILIKCN